MKVIPENPIQDWLGVEIFSSTFFFLDRWSFVHLLSGLILGFILFRKKTKASYFLLAFFILAGYEVWENLLGDIVFRTETKIDIFWDLIIGMIGVILVFLVKKTSPR